MAPIKRMSSGDGEEAVTARVTRSSTRGTNGGGAAAVLPPPPEPKKKKKAKTVPRGEEVGPVSEVADNGSKTKTIVIEHCKQCSQFKIRAAQVKSGLENVIPGIIVVVNPEKPRRGCFEIREEGGEKFITLLDMPRPFKRMRELDMDKVISDIIDKIK